eukprot:CAMPEP_0113668232 /NCGR_PEP_ID=MMETSP0038_2-20120614/3889_1 /TAXON_ID=2898 /ORGANISM="Cryptomonas paramecium" /LENGTH=83 /DNA_ID=CAMNT_0000583959 /DNA_START=87 /DNA_END=338 /DNA_ORIENTATION=+ /assembly_acc=CAM_ASM_000170
MLACEVPTEMKEGQTERKWPNQTRREPATTPRPPPIRTRSPTAVGQLGGGPEPLLGQARAAVAEVEGVRERPPRRSIAKAAKH